jgi:transcriptional regulator with XRE-family HTH domain
MENIEKIKKYRIAADLSWKELAEKIGMSCQYLQNIAYGNQTPGPRKEYKINRFYTEHKADIEAAIGPLDAEVSAP